MAKDPAFLFYSSDFTMGTSLMSHEQKGMYITLLCLQHQTGHLTYDDMISVCGSYDSRVFGKFIKDEKGLFYNERLEIEHFKRKSYCESRGKNRKSEKEEIISDSYEPHMENENEDTIGNKSVLFRNSAYFDFDKFFTVLNKGEYAAYDLKFYYNSVLDWSDANNKKKGDWVATARNFMRKDLREGKVKMNVQNNKPNINSFV